MGLRVVMLYKYLSSNDPFILQTTKYSNTYTNKFVSNNFTLLKGANYDDLLPLCNFVIHYGGHGIFHDCLKLGKV